MSKERQEGSAAPACPRFISCTFYLAYGSFVRWKEYFVREGGRPLESIYVRFLSVSTIGFLGVFGQVIGP